MEDVEQVADSLTPSGAPLPNSYRIPGTHLYAGEYPFSIDVSDGRRKLESCLKAGITSFIDLTESADGLASYVSHLTILAGERGIATRHIPSGFRDNGVPEAPQMRQILDVIDGELDAGRAAYVHCWGGVGRTGVVIGCHLVRRGMTGDDALRIVSELFQTMSPDKVARHRKWGSPQTDEQRRFVREWTESK